MLLPDGHESHKGRSVSTVTFAAPIEINGTTGILAVVVKQTGKNRYKTHRILMPDGSMFTFDIRKAESTGSGVNIEGNVQGSDIDSASIGSVPQTSGEVKGKIQKSRKTAETEREYLELAKDPVKNETMLWELKLTTTDTFMILIQ